MDEERVKKLFQLFGEKTILIIGDAMLDAYLWGQVDRTSPEADVPVVSLTGREEWLGGAANVALNIAALGANPLLCSVVGDDDKEAVFKTLMHSSGMSSECIIQEKGRTTTVKTRVISNNQHMLRIDEEMTGDIHAETEIILIQLLKDVISAKQIDVILLQDYDKGVLTRHVIESVTAIAEKQNIPVIVDPKHRNFNNYKNVTLFKPNLKELIAGIGELPADIFAAETLVFLNEFRRDRNIKQLMVTLSDKGMLLIDEDGHSLIPAHQTEAIDVSGAGDTVIGIAGLCIAAGLNAEEMLKISNLAGGLVCKEVGVVPINKTSLYEAIITVL